MKLLILAVFAATAVLLSSQPGAAGEPVAHQLDSPRTTIADVFHTLGAGLTVPPEWGGIWAVTDSTYNCIGGPTFTGTETFLDTLCAGMEIIPDFDPGIFPTVDCTGTVDGSSVDMLCTASSEVFQDCFATITIQINATRSGENYDGVTTTNISYNGTAFGCSSIPALCTQINSHGMRTAAEPMAYCMTPTESKSWGEVKVRYR